MELLAATAAAASCLRSRPPIHCTQQGWTSMDMEHMYFTRTRSHSEELSNPCVSVTKLVHHTDRQPPTTRNVDGRIHPLVFDCQEPIGLLKNDPICWRVIKYHMLMHELDLIAHWTNQVIVLETEFKPPAIFVQSCTSLWSTWLFHWLVTVARRMVVSRKYRDAIKECNSRPDCSLAKQTSTSGRNMSLRRVHRDAAIGLLSLCYIHTCLQSIDMRKKGPLDLSTADCLTFIDAWLYHRRRSAPVSQE